MYAEIDYKGHIHHDIPLEPCPFCGGTPDLMERGDGKPFLEVYSLCSCGCEMVGGEYDQYNEDILTGVIKAADVWNTRTPTQQQRENDQAVRGIVESVKAGKPFKVKIPQSGGLIFLSATVNSGAR